ncbi:competence protein CoiA family protein [Nostoc sp. UHCC 0870]|uniref:competence protein CoiA family protein n=1 Tax=Nostoc sp. UHCC 0870 TaxID=2914041 RepID=UPI001EDF995B|nr:competence protein CoiA family protein [Nostoc sp. UHCC 0870]UKP01449.1 hypothetical protein L6494_30050 [Nostoc sp. UHCC 0870]
MFAIGKEILYSIAKTDSGELVKAVDAEKNENYLCLVCDQTLILHKGTKKRPHFTHKSLSSNCKPETALHYGFKVLLHQSIQAHINRKQPLEIRWKCKYCSGGSHSGNLLKKATQVELEYDLGICRPDIALLDSSGKIIACIEVIVTHAPSRTTLEYYKQNRIALVSYVLKSDQDIYRLNNPILQPDAVDLCLNPKCPECGMHMPKKYMLIINGKCWKCNSPMKVAALRGDAGYEGDFSASDIQLANQHGAFLAKRYSKTAGEEYVVNTCRKCQAIIGSHYLFTDYVAFSEYSREKLEAGYYCPHC